MSTTDERPEDDSPWQATAESPRERLLVVDDQPMNIRALHDIFAATHDVFMATSGEQALAFCRATPPDLVLLDVVMPQMSGLEVCRRLKQDPETAPIPVIFVTALDNPEEEEACWTAGGVDFITKPINAQTTRHRVRAHLTLKRQADVLRRLAWIDGLTGLANKRQFDERWIHEWKRCRRDGLSLAVATIDIDNFKAYNDTYGHLPGDDCLRSVALALRNSLARPGDFAARTGGEEFTCVMPEADVEGARLIASRIEHGRPCLADSPHWRCAGHCHGIGGPGSHAAGGAGAAGEPAQTCRPGAVPRQACRSRPHCNRRRSAFRRGLKPIRYRRRPASLRGCRD
jgi:PleD family two-component response regulator